MFTWGYGDGGRLGHGDETNQQTPKRVEALIGEKAKAVSCGRYHNVLCTEDGKMYTFGWGTNGELGHGDKENKASPALVHALHHTSAVWS
jgi:alpha-tubulin suppressor-like RCC1 family protein